SRHDSLLFVPALCTERSAMEQLAEVVATLYINGVTPDFAAFDRPWQRRKLALPTYPFQRQRYWVEQLSAPCQVEDGVPHLLWGSKQRLATGGEVHARELSVPQLPYLGDHRVF